MVVVSPENFAITRQRGFTLQGISSSNRKKAERIERGDRVLFYISGIRRFAATATVASGIQESHEPLWKSPKEGEDFPHRFGIRRNVLLREEDFLDADEISPRLDYVRKWPPERWPLAFQGDLHLISKRDLQLLEVEMRKVLNRRRSAARR
ncbi:MAG: EVE domain-containing protein [Dehalococcoidia bacterium]